MKYRLKAIPAGNIITFKGAKVYVAKVMHVLRFYSLAYLLDEDEMDV